MGVLKLDGGEEMRHRTDLLSTKLITKLLLLLFYSASTRAFLEENVVSHEAEPSLKAILAEKVDEIVPLKVAAKVANLAAKRGEDRSLLTTSDSNLRGGVSTARTRRDVVTRMLQRHMPLKKHSTSTTHKKRSATIALIVAAMKKKARVKISDLDKAERVLMKLEQEMTSPEDTISQSKHQKKAKKERPVDTVSQIKRQKRAEKTDSVSQMKHQKKANKISKTDLSTTHEGKAKKIALVSSTAKEKTATQALPQRNVQSARKPGSTKSRHSSRYHMRRLVLPTVFVCLSIGAMGLVFCLMQ